MHTDSTLKIFDEITADIGAEFRTFERETCSVFDTRELPREANARQRRKKRANKGVCLRLPNEGLWMDLLQQRGEGLKNSIFRRINTIRSATIRIPSVNMAHQIHIQRSQ
jgi:hypothetical protein